MSQDRNKDFVTPIQSFTAINFKMGFQFDADGMALSANQMKAPRAATHHINFKLKCPFGNFLAEMLTV